MQPLIFAVALSVLLSGCGSNSVPERGPDSWSGEVIRKAVAEHSQTSSELFALCETMAVYGEFIGEARADGAPVNVAMTDATDRLVRRTGVGAGDGLDLNTRVFAVLAYELDESHAPETVGAYTLLACMTIHGLKRTMPVDIRSQETIGERLTACAEASDRRDDLGACVIRRIAPMVKNQL